MIRAAAYIRVSTEEQVLHGYSLQAQRETLEQYEKKHDDVQIVGWYTDEGISARKSATHRKALQQLLADLEPKKINMILFIKLDRWFRNIGEYHKVQEVLDKHNVHWKAILENYDTSTSGGRLHINIMLSVAQDEADRTSERIKFVFKNKVTNGELLNGKLPIGLKKEGKYAVPDLETAHIACDIFDYYDRHANLHRTAKYLNDTYGIAMADVVLRKTLRNKIYAGERHGNKEFCEPLIPQEQFERVQKLLDNNIKHTPSGRIYIFTGLVICSLCGHRMTSSSALKKSDARRYYYYRCPEHHQRSKKCPHNKQINEEALERYLLDNLDRDLNDYIVRQFEQIKKQPKKSANDKDKIQAKLKKLKELYVNDMIDMQEYKADYDMYMRQLEEIPEQPQLETPDRLERLQQFADSDFKSAYVGLDSTGKQSFWRSIIKEIWLDGDNNVVKIVYA